MRRIESAYLARIQKTTLDSAEPTLSIFQRLNPAPDRLLKTSLAISDSFSPFCCSLFRTGDATTHFGGYGDGSSDAFLATLSGANGYRVVTSSAVQTVSVANRTAEGYVP